MKFFDSLKKIFVKEGYEKKPFKQENVQEAKKKLELVSESELKEELERAKEARKKFEETQRAAGKPVASAGPQIKVLKLKNGIYVTKKNELVDALEAMDDATFKAHVDDKKNDVADWLADIDKELADKVRVLKTRMEMFDEVKKKVDAEVAASTG